MSGNAIAQYCPHCDDLQLAVNAFHPERGPSQHCEECESWDLYDSKRAYFQSLFDQIEGNLGVFCLRVPSWDGAHHLLYTEEKGWKAVYAGPNGPENRPADIDEENRWRMVAMADDVEMIPTEDSPFAEVEVAGDA